MDSTISGSAINHPPTPNHLYLSDAAVTGTQFVGGMVTLNGEAPATGTEVFLGSNDPRAGVDNSVMVAPNTFAAQFEISTMPVAVDTPVTISASASGATQTATFTVMPPAISSVWLNYISVRGGTPIKGLVSLVAPAPPSGMIAHLVSSNPALVKVTKDAKVPGGQQSGAFYASTKRVMQTTTVTVTAEVNGAVRSTTIRLIP
jgi:hypothetical protein